jgi:hypothetical protein
MKPKQVKKGMKLELKTAAYFQSFGYLVRRGVKLAVAAGTADITDIDLLALKFRIPLSEERLIADCRDRKKLRPFQRILWTLGLVSFSQANRAVVVLPHAPWQAREFASQASIEILGTPIIDSHLQSIKMCYSPFGEASQELSAQYDKTIKLVAAKAVVREDLKLRQMMVIGNPLTNFNRIIRILTATGDKLKHKSDELTWLKRYICFNAAVTACVMLVRFVAKAKWLPERDWTDYAKKKLTYGDIPPHKATQLAKLALERNFSNGLPAPQYADEIIEIIRFLIKQPDVGGLSPYVMDYQLFGHVLGNIDSEKALQSLGSIKTRALTAVRRILSAIAYAAELNADFWVVENLKQESAEEHIQKKLPLE